MIPNDFFHSPVKMWLVGLLIVAIVSGGAAYQPKLLKGLKGSITANQTVTYKGTSADLFFNGAEGNATAGGNDTEDMSYNVNFDITKDSALAKITVNGFPVPLFNVSPFFLLQPPRFTVSLSTRAKLEDPLTIEVTDNNGAKHILVLTKTGSTTATNGVTGATNGPLILTLSGPDTIGNEAVFSFTVPGNVLATNIRFYISKKDLVAFTGLQVSGADAAFETADEGEWRYLKMKTESDLSGKEIRVSLKSQNTTGAVQTITVNGGGFKNGGGPDTNPTDHLFEIEERTNEKVAVAMTDTGGTVGTAGGSGTATGTGTGTGGTTTGTTTTGTTTTTGESSTTTTGTTTGGTTTGSFSTNNDLPTRQIFVTSDTYTPNQFRGYPFMDALCDKVATEAGVKHTPGGQGFPPAQGWAALVSSKVEPKRVAADLLKDGVVYTRVPNTAVTPTPKDPRDKEEKGRVEIGTKTDIMNGTPKNPVVATQRGKNGGETGLPFYYFNEGKPWTGTLPTSGQPSDFHCEGWSSGQAMGTYGNADGIADILGKNHSPNCTEKRPLYCVEQDEVTPAAVSTAITQTIVGGQPVTVIVPPGTALVGATFTPSTTPAAGEKSGIYYTEYKKQPTGETVPSNSKFVSGFDVSLPGVGVKEGCVTIKIYEKEFPGTIERNFAILHTKKDGTKEWLNWADKGIVTDAAGVYHNLEVCSKSFSPFSIYSVPDTKNPDSNTPPPVTQTNPPANQQPATSNQQPGSISYGAIGNTEPATPQSADAGRASNPSTTLGAGQQPSAPIVTQEQAVLNQNKLKQPNAVEEKVVFSDVGSKSPYKAAIQKVAGMGIMTESRDPLKPSQQLFKENNALNRAELTAIVTRWLFPAHGSPEKMTCTFKDVDLSAWFGNPVLKACEEKLVKGYGDNSFRPESSVNVVEALKIVVEAGSRFAPKTVGASLKAELASQKSTDQWYSAYLRTAEKNGLLTGAEVLTVKKNPSASASRGWIAQLIANIL